MSGPQDERTIDTLATGAVTTGVVTAATPSHPAADKAGRRRFAPGAIIAGRYRLVALLGRGGMGEVYRADDLTLDQPVALKFLPAGVAAGDTSLSRFHNELRVARQVSHKNVCRLYDLGDADGHRFLTMEYVDGEDLASLLRRIGRIPQDKAVQIARQLCAGVAAAHERGVLHRDLKPANVMIDGDGDVRITDFGIATAAADTGQEFVGTPQYMAPEQFAGQPASVSSDLYALGLTLYELFTGRRAYESKTLADLKAFHETGTLPTPTTIVRDLDPAVDRVILRCLDKNPERRPASALAVAAGLPGGDALADALAAGETPSPELLAAAAESDALDVGRGLIAVALIVAGVFVYASLSGRTSFVGRTPQKLAPVLLIDKAKAAIRAAGYPDTAVDEASNFDTADDYLNWVRNNRGGRDRWDILSTGNPSALRFWYRSSPRVMEPSGPETVSIANPPVNITGMRLVILDAAGRLQEFRSVPPQRDAGTDSPLEVSWEPLFSAAGLDISAFTPVNPQWTPRDYADTLAAWEGPLPGVAGGQLRIEAGAYRGRPVSFLLVGPWTSATLMGERRRDPIDRMFALVLVILFVPFIASAVVMARRNLRRGRADSRGAARVAATLGALLFLSWPLEAGLLSPLGNQLLVAAWVVLMSGVLWMVYLAIEPYVRKFWPHALLGWSRLLAGHVRDPRVGRDVLIGVLCGVALGFGDVGRTTLLPWLGFRAPQPTFGNEVEILAGAGPVLSQWLVWLFYAVEGAFLTVLLVVLLRLVLRRVWLALAVSSLLLMFSSANYMFSSTQWMWLFALASGIILSVVTVRFGLLSLAVTRFVWNVLNGVPMTVDFSHWSATASNASLVLIIGLALFGYYASRAGQPLFGNVLGD